MLSGGNSVAAPRSSQSGPGPRSARRPPPQAAAEPGIEMEQQALGLLTIEILYGARGALGTTGHG